MRRLSRVAAPLLALLLLAGCETELFTNLAESDANEMLALLQTNGLSAAKTRQKDGRDTLSVEQGQFARAVALLRDAGLPRRSFQSIGDVFAATGLVASPMQERARFIWALGQELSRTISDIDGVMTARVQVVLPNNDLLNRDPTPSSASVFVRYDARSAVATLVPQIKQLVANSVEGLGYDRVSVVLVPAAVPERVVVEDAGGAGNGAGARLGVFAVLAALAAGGWAAATRLRLAGSARLAGATRLAGVMRRWRRADVAPGRVE